MHDDDEPTPKDIARASLWDTADPFVRLAAMAVARGMDMDLAATRYSLVESDVKAIPALADAYLRHPDFRGWLAAQGHTMKTSLV